MGLRVKEELITGCQILDRNQNKKPEQAINGAETCNFRHLPGQDSYKDWTHPWAAQKAHLGLDNLLLEEELRNFSNPSVLSSILHFSIATETRESQCLVPFIYITNIHCILALLKTLHEASQTYVLTFPFSSFVFRKVSQLMKTWDYLQVQANSSSFRLLGLAFLSD